MTASADIVAVDIGNTRVKIGHYLEEELISGDVLPKPEQVLISRSEQFQEFDLWLREPTLPKTAKWVLSSVNSQWEKAFLDWLSAKRPGDTIQKLSHDNVSFPIELDYPEKVGVDRLCNARAALCLKDPGEPSLVVDLGTAITLDVLTGEGVFRGGAIMPGFNCAARGLNQLTELLPLIDTEELRLPEFPGRNTTAALEAGIFWGIIGAIRQFLALAQESRPALLVLTGGNAYQIWEALLNPYANSQSESVMCESTRVTDSSGVGNTQPAHQTEEEMQTVPDNGFVPVHRFHEVICCPYLTLSGIALCGISIS